MAFPTTITTTSASINFGSATPHISSTGNVYVLLRGSTISKLTMFKATDPSSSFSAVGTDPQVTSTNDIHGVNTYQVGDIIHVVTVDYLITSSQQIRYHQFDMSSDTWTLTNEAIKGTGFNGNEAVTGIGVNVRSTGDVVVFYLGATAAVMGNNRGRVYYAKRVSGTWTVDVAVDAGGAISYNVSDMILGSSDRSHLYWLDENTGQVQSRTLNSAYTLGTTSNYDTTIDASPLHQADRGISYDSGGTQKVRHPYADSAANTISSAKCDSADTPTITSDVDITGATTAFIGTYASSMSANGTDLYCVFIESASGDIRYVKNANDAGWGGETTIQTSTNTTVSYSNIYTRNSDIVLATVFLNTNPIYTEKVLVPGDTTPKDIEWDCYFGYGQRRIRR